MATESQRPKVPDGVLSSLNMAIGALNRAEATNTTPAKAALTSASALLTMIRDSMISKADYVELGLTCAGVCETLTRRMDGRQADQLSQSVLEAIEEFTTTAAEIRGHIIRRGKRNVISRRYHTKDDKKAIAAWRLDLNGILQVFNNELVTSTHPTVSDIRHDIANVHTAGSDVHHDIPNADNIVPNILHGISGTHLVASEVRNDVANTHVAASDIHRDKLKGREGASVQNHATHASAPGKSPAPLPINIREIIPNIRRDVISEVHRGIADTQAMVHDIRNMLKSQQGTGGQLQLIQNSVSGELPPPPPRVFFGRDEFIEKIVNLAQRLAPIALIGAGGIGKTSIILTILHDDRIKQRFGDNRCFIRCDQFPASHTYFLRRLSKVIGAGIENPEDLAPLRRYLSSKEMVIVLDNVESILDPQGTNTQEIYAVVDELSRFNNICLCITSRISTIPPHCEVLYIPTLSMEAARDTFYRIYKYGEQADPINDILEELDFHPLSITLLATAAQYNTWDTDRLTREWERRRTGVLHAQHSVSLATTIELSLASPMFQELGPHARGLLGVVAFFPQGANERNIDWLFPTISDGLSVFDTFCILSLTYRSNGFVTMLAPLRDYLRPKEPASSPLLSTTKECYFARLSADVFPDKPGFEESRWIRSEDVNVEHLLDVFTSIDGNLENVWDACGGFMGRLFWHKPRLVMLGPKIEALPDDHPSKTRCSWTLSWLFGSVGNDAERKRLLTQTLQACREQGNNQQVAQTLCYLCDSNRQMALFKEGVQQAREGSEIFERLGNTVKQAECLISLSYVLGNSYKFDAAEEAASRAIDLLPKKGEQFLVCMGYRGLGEVYSAKGNTKKAIRHFKVALEIATSLNLDSQMFYVHHNLAELFSGEGKFDDAQTHIERSKTHAINDPHNMARAMEQQASLWSQQRMFEKAKFEALRAADIYEKLGAAHDLGTCRDFIWRVDKRIKKPVVPVASGADG